MSTESLCCLHLTERASGCKMMRSWNHSRWSRCPTGCRSESHNGGSCPTGSCYRICSVQSELTVTRWLALAWRSYEVIGVDQLGNRTKWQDIFIVLAAVELVINSLPLEWALLGENTTEFWKRWEVAAFTIGCQCLKHQLEVSHRTYFLSQLHPNFLVWLQDHEVVVLWVVEFSNIKVDLADFYASKLFVWRIVVTNVAFKLGAVKGKAARLRWVRVLNIDIYFAIIVPNF